MLNIALVFVGFIVILVLIMRGLIWWTTKVIKVYVEGHNRAAEAILTNGRPPEDWVDKSNRKIERLKARPEGMTKANKMGERIKKKSLRKVSKLIVYFKTATLVQDEETREMLMDELKKAHDSWEKKKWAEIMAIDNTQSERVLTEREE